MMNVLIWVFGIGAMICLFSIYQQKERRKLILCKLGADVCWVIHYVLLNALSGAVPNFVGIFRELVFVNREEKKWAQCPVWPILFIGINLTLGILTYQSPVSLLPICASVFVTISLWLRNPKLTKIITLPVCCAFLIYDILVGSYIGIVNESLSILSIVLSLFGIQLFGKKKEENTQEDSAMNTIFSSDTPTGKEPVIRPGKPIAEYSAKLTTEISDEAQRKGELFSAEIEERFISDFEKPGDQMCHVSTFLYSGDTLYMTYYANTQGSAEDPNFQTARLVYCPIDHPEEKTFLDIQSVGEPCYDGEVVMVYDTILMQKDEHTLYVLWTANISGNYYRLWRSFDMLSKTLGPVQVNRFQVGNVINDFSTTGMQSAMAENEISFPKMFSDIGIMQKLSSRVENGEIYYYTGTYSGGFNAIIKSRDLITWEYVAQPDFDNFSKWENAVYVVGDKCYYFVRQFDEESDCGFLTALDLNTGKWDTPVLIQDCQSRSDFIMWDGELYLFHAPTDREHIGMVHIDCRDLAGSKVVFQAKMASSCFYPFIQYNNEGGLCMSYTVNRKHIRLAAFSMEKYV